MKAILEFDLDDHDDLMAHKRCIKALDMSLVLWELKHNMRKGCEHLIEMQDMTDYEMLDHIYEKINELLDDHNIIIDELVN